MVYRLYVETAKKGSKTAWAFTFYNHQDFLVYKRSGTCELQEENAVVLDISATALEYFERSMRRRYYDEHFSTRIDEDYVTLYTSVLDIVNTASAIKENNQNMYSFCSNDNAWSRLIPFFQQKTMSFEIATDKKFINFAKELAKEKLK